jgi:hypothetical protein
LSGKEVREEECNFQNCVLFFSQAWVRVGISRRVDGGSPILLILVVASNYMSKTPMPPII